MDLATETIRPIKEILDEETLLTPRLLATAEFISGYYRCPLGTTLAAMLPARLLRSDAEEAALTPTGAAVDLDAVAAPQRAILETLRAAPKLTIPTLLSRTGDRGRSALDATIDAGWVRLRRRRRDRPPQQSDWPGSPSRTCSSGAAAHHDSERSSSGSRPRTGPLSQPR
jgi:primosomal protein N'